MSKKKILIVCGTFYPDNNPRSLRATELAKEFARTGNNVTVCFPMEERHKTKLSTINDIEFITTGKAKLRYIYTKGGRLKVQILRIIRRILLQLFEYPDIELMFKVARTLKRENGYDLLISLAVPHPIHWGVAIAVKENRELTKTWVADNGDPYSGCRTDSFKKMFYFRYLEKRSFRIADYLSVPMTDAVSGYSKEFHHKIVIIPQGVSMNHNNLPAFESHSGPKIFIYAGGFILGKRDPTDFLEFLVRCKEDFRFLIYTNQPEFISDYSREYPDKIIVKEYLPREKLLEELSKADFLINFDNNTKVQSPSKLIDYSLSGRPILNISKSFNRAHFYEFLEGDYQNRMIIEDVEQYDIRKIALKFLCLVKE